MFRLPRSFPQPLRTNAVAQFRAMKPQPAQSRALCTKPITEKARSHWPRRMIIGVGVVSLALFGRSQRLHDLADASYSNSPLNPGAYGTKGKPKLMVLGTGWGAVSFLKQLNREEYDICVVSPRNYFMFTPLLPSTTVGTVETRSIIDPIRNLFPDVTFYEAECTEVDPDTKKITCFAQSPIAKAMDCKKTINFELPYDKLVISVGAGNNTFNIPGVEENVNRGTVHFLREVPDARRIRSAINDCMETASLPSKSDGERQRLLHFIVVGGGPSGVEFAAELQDFANEDLKYQFPRLAREVVKVTLVEASGKILGMYGDVISHFTEKTLQNEHIDLQKNVVVKEIKPREMIVFDKNLQQERVIPYGICVWATGIKPLPLVQKLLQRYPEAQKDRRGLLVDWRLRMKGAKDIYALGDCTTLELKKLQTIGKDLFAKGATNDKLSLDHVEALLVEKQKEYPQVEFVGYKKLHSLAVEHDKDNDGALTMDEFNHYLVEVDKAISFLPPTAQVAHQQGHYLAHWFNSSERETEDSWKPFRYRHLGGLAYIGHEKAIANFNFADILPISVKNYTYTGFGSYWLWRSIYLSFGPSMRSRVLICFDWFKTWVFGRDTSRY